MVTAERVDRFDGVFGSDRGAAHDEPRAPVSDCPHCGSPISGPHGGIVPPYWCSNDACGQGFMAAELNRDDR